MRLGLGLGLDKNRILGGVASYDYLLSGNGDAAVAYSLRAVNPDYSGALVLIRRSSDNAEKAFLKDANNIFSLSSEDGSGTSLATWIGSDNGFLKTIYDQSGNGNNATQTNASLQNRIISAGVLELENSKVAANDTVGGNYNIATDVTLTGADGYYIIGVYKNSNSQKILNKANNHIWPYNASNIEYRENGSTFYPSGLTTNNSSQTLFRFARNQTNNVHFKMNLSEVTAANTDSGKQLIFNDLFLCSGTKQEFIAFASNKFSDDTTLVSNVNTYYSIY